MSKKNYSKIVTANDLILGHVVYLTENNIWSELHSNAELFSDPVQAEEKLKEISRSDRIIGPYLADAAYDTAGIAAPVHIRERIRTTGPTNYPA